MYNLLCIGICVHLNCNKIEKDLYIVLLHIFIRTKTGFYSFQIYTFPHISYSIFKHNILKKKDYDVIVRLTIAMEKADKNVVEES